MKVELISIDELKPFERNPKIHSEEQIKKLVKSIEEFGWTNPVLVLRDSMMVIAGHARLEAAQRLNIREIPAILLDLPYEKAIAYNVADNRLAELAEWDNETLAGLLDEIKSFGLDLELTGFTEKNMGDLNINIDDFFEKSNHKHKENQDRRLYCPSCGSELPENYKKV